MNSIVPEIIHSKKIKFFNERDVEIILCEESDSNYIPPFDAPYLRVKTFAEKTTKPPEIFNIDVIDLEKLGIVLASRRTSHGWFRGQKVI